jgi:ribonuclease inhibitor
MKTLIIDGRHCKTQEQTHAYLAGKPIFPPYYGKNLDALYDVLSSLSTPVQIIIRYPSAITAYLGEYGENFLCVFEEAKQCNQNVTLKIK